MHRTKSHGARLGAFCLAGLCLAAPVLAQGNDEPDDLHCTEFDRYETLTPNDTLSLITAYHNPEQARGFVVVYVVDAVGDAVASDNLIGSLMVINGIERFAIPEQAPLTEFQRHRLWPLVVGFYVYDTNRSAFDALVSSGKIDLLDDREVLGKLREYYYLVNALDRTQTRTILPMRNHFIELGIARGLSPEGPVDEDLLVRKVGDDPALAASIAASREYAALHLYLAQLLDGKAHELQQLLKRQAQ